MLTRTHQLHFAVLQTADLHSSRSFCSLHPFFACTACIDPRSLPQRLILDLASKLLTTHNRLYQARLDRFMVRTAPHFFRVLFSAAHQLDILSLGPAGTTVFSIQLSPTSQPTAPQLALHGSHLCGTGRSTGATTHAPPRLRQPQAPAVTAPRFPSSTGAPKRLAPVWPCARRRRCPARRRRFLARRRPYGAQRP